MRYARHIVLPHAPPTGMNECACIWRSFVESPSLLRNAYRGRAHVTQPGRCRRKRRLAVQTLLSETRFVYYYAPVRFVLQAQSNRFSLARYTLSHGSIVILSSHMYACIRIQRTAHSSHSTWPLFARCRTCEGNECSEYVRLNVLPSTHSRSSVDSQFSMASNSLHSADARIACVNVS